MNSKQKEYLKLKQEMALGDIEQAKNKLIYTCLIYLLR